METFKEIGDRLEMELQMLTRFKIGKTGQSIEDRFNEEYADVYNDHKVIGTSADKETINEFEEYMINRFMELPNCDNQQVGGGEMRDSNSYLVYIVSNA